MKVYIVTTESIPHGMASTKRILSYGKALGLAGIDCEVIVYRSTERYGISTQNIHRTGCVAGIKFSYIPKSPVRENNALVRQIMDRVNKLRLISFLNKTLNSGDVVIGYNNYDLFSAEIIKTVHKLGASYYQELCELPFGSVEQTDSTRRNRIKFEKSVLANVDGVIAISNSLVEYACMHCPSDINIIRMPIIVDFEDYDIADLSSNSQVPYIFHSGTLYEQKDGFLSMLKAIAEARKRILIPFKFISTGDLSGSRHEQEIKELLDKLDIHDIVDFIGYVDENKLKYYLSHASLVIINKLSTQQNQYCFSTKLAEYMAASKPIITTNVGEVVNWLKPNFDAMIISPDNIQTLTDAIVEMMSNGEFRRRLGANARETCRNSFSIENCCNIFKTHFLPC